ncbi:MAG: hypothetical protein AABZ55_11140 [Bdellovibrionota bacterium]
MNLRIFVLSMTIAVLAVPSFAAEKTFKMYHEPRAEVDTGCDAYTELRLDIRGKTAVATLVNRLAGTCDLHVSPKKRAYVFNLADTDCGTKTYSWTDGADYEAELADNRTRTCENVIPALIVLKEINQNDGTVSVLYSI